MEHLPSYQSDTANSTGSKLELREQRDKTEGQYSTTTEIQVEEWSFLQKLRAATAVFKISGNKEYFCN